MAHRNNATVIAKFKFKSYYLLFLVFQKSRSGNFKRRELAFILYKWNVTNGLTTIRKMATLFQPRYYSNDVLSHTPLINRLNVYNLRCLNFRSVL